MSGAAKTLSLSRYLEIMHIHPVRLHLGCGGVSLPNYVNVDLYPDDPSVRDSSRSGCAADAFADMRDLGLANSSVSEIFSAHTLEHFPRWESTDMLRDWFRMCMQGAHVVIETPRFWSCVVGLFVPSKKVQKLARVQFYGNQNDRLDYETHRYVWGGAELRDTLMDIGFRHVTVSWWPSTHCRIRDMRVTAIK